MNKRIDADDLRTADTAVIETLRASSAPPPAVHSKKSDEEKVSLFWRVFGGAIISVAALAGLTLYNTITSNVSELRAEVARLNEAKVDAAKKDEVTTLRTQAGEFRREMDAVKERLSKHRLELDAERKESAAALDGVKKEMAALEKEWQKQLTEAREKIARLEGQQKPMKPADDR